MPHRLSITAGILLNAFLGIGYAQTLGQISVHGPYSKEAVLEKLRSHDTLTCEDLIFVLSRSVFHPTLGEYSREEKEDWFTRVSDRCAFSFSYPRKLFSKAKEMVFDPGFVAIAIERSRPVRKKNLLEFPVYIEKAMEAMQLATAKSLIMEGKELLKMGEMRMTVSSANFDYLVGAFDGYAKKIEWMEKQKLISHFKHIGLGDLNGWRSQEDIPIYLVFLDQKSFDLNIDWSKAIAAVSKKLSTISNGGVNVHFQEKKLRGPLDANANVYWEHYPEIRRSLPDMPVKSIVIVFDRVSMDMFKTHYQYQGLGIISMDPAILYALGEVDPEHQVFTLTMLHEILHGLGAVHEFLGPWKSKKDPLTDLSSIDEIVRMKEDVKKDQIRQFPIVGYPKNPFYPLSQFQLTPLNCWLIGFE